MIDIPTLIRNLKDCIQQWPLKCRHSGRDFDCWQNSTADMLQAIEGAVRDNMMITIIGVRSEFGERLPKSMDDFELLLGDVHSKWVTFQVRDVPDFWDTASPLITINLQSPHTGIG